MWQVIHRVAHLLLDRAAIGGAVDNVLTLMIVSRVIIRASYGGLSIDNDKVIYNNGRIPIKN